MQASIGATLHSIVEGKLPCQKEGQSVEECETAQNIGMDCCAECVSEEVFHRQDDRASGKTRRQTGNGSFAIGCSIDIVDDGEGVDGIVLYDVIRKLDALSADMKKFYEEQGWEYPNEVSKIH